MCEISRAIHHFVSALVIVDVNDRGDEWREPIFVCVCSLIFNKMWNSGKYLNVTSIISYILMRKRGKKWKNIFYALQNHSYPFDVVEFAPNTRSYLLGWCQLCCSFHLDINSILLQSRYCHLIPLESIQFLSLLIRSFITQLWTFQHAYV